MAFLFVSPWHSLTPTFELATCATYLSLSLLASILHNTITTLFGVAGAVYKRLKESKAGRCLVCIKVGEALLNVVNTTFF